MGRPVKGFKIRKRAGRAWSVRFSTLGRQVEYSTCTHDEAAALQNAERIYQTKMPGLGRIQRRSARALSDLPNISTVPETPGVYCVHLYGNHMKIGRAKNIAKRVASFQTVLPDPVRLVAVLSQDPEDERRFHLLFEPWRVHGELFLADQDFLDRLSDI